MPRTAGWPGRETHRRASVAIRSGPTRVKQWPTFGGFTLTFAFMRTRAQPIRCPLQASG